MTEEGSEEEGYIRTTTHNYVSRKAIVDGAKQVEIRGRSILQEGVRVKGDLAIVRIGRYCEIEQDTLLEPPVHPLKTQRIPIVVGSHTHIGKNCQIHAAAIGSMVWIGDNVHLGERVIIKDNCVIESNVRLGADTVLPPFSRISIQNPTMPTVLPPSMSAHMQQLSLDRYQEFKQQEQITQ